MQRMSEEFQHGKRVGELLNCDRRHCGAWHARHDTAACEVVCNFRTGCDANVDGLPALRADLNHHIFIRAIPSVDIRSITSVLVFGPFTLIRPPVVLTGAIWGLLAAPTVNVVLLLVLVVSLMLGMEYALDRLRACKLIS